MHATKSQSVKLPASVRKSLKEVSARLSSFKKSDFVHKDLFNPSVHLLNRQGKLVRPTLVLLGAYLLTENPKKYVDLAVAAELIHTSSLIHDDIIDRDSQRRGLETVHKKYGSEAALLAGDALIAKAIYISSKYGPEVMNAMAKSSIDMCAGEILDNNFQKSGKVPSVEECLKIADLKSASLITTCCSIAAVRKHSKQSKNIYQFGKDVGIAFQIRDDIIDYISWSNRGRKERLVPNIVSSIQAQRGVSSRAALIEAGKLNERYLSSASRRLGGGAAARLIESYANLMMVKG